MTGDKAGEAKRRKDSKFPCIMLLIEMINMYGNIRRFKKTAARIALGSEINTVSDNTDNKRRKNNAQHRYKSQNNGRIVNAL